VGAHCLHWLGGSLYPEPLQYHTIPPNRAHESGSHLSLHNCLRPRNNVARRFSLSFALKCLAWLRSKLFDLLMLAIKIVPTLRTQAPNYVGETKSKCKSFIFFHFAAVVWLFFVVWMLFAHLLSHRALDQPHPDCHSSSSPKSATPTWMRLLIEPRPRSHGRRRIRGAGGAAGGGTGQVS